MMRTTLTLLAALALVGAGAAGALFATPDKLSIVAGGHDDARNVPPPPAPDRTGEVLAEIGSLRDALRAFAQGLDAAAEERDAARREALDRAATVSKRLDALERATARTASAAEALLDQAEAPPPAPPAAAPEPEPEAAEAPPPPAPAARRRKSLASLLAEREHVDVRDTLASWRLVSGHCRVGFDGVSTVHNFTAKSDAATGSLKLHVNAPGDRPSGAVALEVRTLESGVEGRDEEIRENLSRGGHETIRCELLGLEPGAGGAKAKLRFTIRGKSRDVTGRAVLGFTPQRLLSVKGEAKLKMSDFDIHPKAKLGLIRVEDEVTVWWDLYAEPDPPSR